MKKVEEEIRELNRQLLWCDDIREHAKRQNKLLVLFSKYFKDKEGYEDFEYSELKRCFVNGLLSHFNNVTKESNK